MLQQEQVEKDLGKKDFLFTFEKNNYI